MLRNLVHRAVRWSLIVIAGLIAASVLLVLMFRIVPVFGSMVMVERKVQSWLMAEPIDIRHDWVSWDRLSGNAKIAVIAAEDQNFPHHHGFDFEQLREALSAWRAGEDLRGASTISQQTAKNLFLWTGRNWLRKGLEAWFTLLIELLWPKERILEVYLNIAEWGGGVFGLEMAARHYYGVSAADLSETQASRLAAILPNPREWSASAPTPYVLERSHWIQRQMRQLGGTSYLQQLSEPSSDR